VPGGVPQGDGAPARGEDVACGGAAPDPCGHQRHGEHHKADEGEPDALLRHGQPGVRGVLGAQVSDRSHAAGLPRTESPAGPARGGGQPHLEGSLSDQLPQGGCPIGGSSSSCSSGGGLC